MATTFITTDRTAATYFGSYNTLVLLEGVTVTSATPGFVFTGEADLSVFGDVYSATNAITLSASGAMDIGITIGQSGSVYGHATGVYIPNTSSAVTLLNNGEITSDGRATYIQSDTVEFTNNGNITSRNVYDAVRFYAGQSGTSSLVVTNSGLMSSTSATAYSTVYVQGYGTASLRNTGTILTQDVAMVFAGVIDVRLDNSGEIFGSIQNYYASRDSFTLINSGLIGSNQAGVSLDIEGNESLIRNSGEIQGDMNFSSTTMVSTVVNAGLIGGDIAFSINDDSYRAVGNGVTMGTVFGNGGNDTLIGGGLNDVFEGGDGADSLRGGGGDDSLKGDGGNDRVLGGDGNDTVRGDDGNDFVHGGNGDDTVRGDAGNDTILGGNGDDYMLAGTGTDIVRGGYGNDEIDGGDGKDTIYGDAGDDTIEGGADQDILDGGAGFDTFVYVNATDSAAGAATRDTILNFAIGEDLIDLSAIAPGVLSFVGTSGFTGTAKEVSLIEVNGLTRVLVDINADGNADAEIIVRGDMGLTADDFVL